MAGKSKSSSTGRATNQCYCHKMFRTQEEYHLHLETEHKQDDGTELWVCTLESCKSTKADVDKKYKSGPNLFKHVRQGIKNNYGK